MKKRKYQLRRRAESQEETRRKIVDALVDLHEHLGPRATTVSAVAAKAGVQRLTVYRHFPDEVAMITACSSHWLSEHPLPDPAIWRAQPDWRGRCRAAFAALYTYYRRNTGMLTSVFRDADLPAMQGPMQGLAAYFGQVHADLLEVAEPALAQNKAFTHTIGHALSFTTWQSLAGDFTDGDMVVLVMTWLEGVVANRLPSR